MVSEVDIVTVAIFVKVDDLVGEAVVVTENVSDCEPLTTAEMVDEPVTCCRLADEIVNDSDNVSVRTSVKVLDNDPSRVCDRVGSFVADFVPLEEADAETSLDFDDSVPIDVLLLNCETDFAGNSVKVSTLLFEPLMDCVNVNAELTVVFNFPDKVRVP